VPAVSLDPAALSDGDAVTQNDGGPVSSSTGVPTCAYQGCDQSVVPGSSFCGREDHTASEAIKASTGAVTGAVGVSGGLADGSGRGRRKPRTRGWRSAWHEGELRVVGSDDATARVSGTAIVYSPWTTIYGEPPGPFRERVMRSAYDAVETLRQGEDRHLLYQHDWSVPPLASVRAGTLHLRNTEHGLLMAADLPLDRPLVRELLPSIRSGGLNGMSFAFLVDPAGGEEWDDDMTHRTITRFLDVPEVTLTPTPAYPQTSVQVERARTRRRAELARARRSRRELDIARIRQSLEYR
jgi:uncharacterized protein